MTNVPAGAMAIVDFKLGGTETRTMTYGGGGGGSLFLGTGVLNGTWTKTQAIQRNTIPMPDGSIRQMTVDAEDIEVLAGSRMSAACFMGNKGRWHWIAVKNHETGEVLRRTFGNKTADNIDMNPPFGHIKAGGAAVAIGLLAYMLLFTFQYQMPTAWAGMLFIGIPFVCLFLWLFIYGRLRGALPVGKIKREGRQMLKDHVWGGDA